MSSQQINPNQKLNNIRHSAEHVLTQAMLRLYPDKFLMAMGPSTDDGFYFDFEPINDFKIKEEDFPKIEAEMQKIIGENLPITRKEITVEEARGLFKNNPYKQEWLDLIQNRNEPVSIYYTGDEFVDLCAGPHVESTSEIKALKLLSIAGAYWHGDEKNKMLTRVYGTAFESPESLENYLKELEEEKNNDHRKIGKELGLFIFSDLVGKGLPMLTPKGATVRRELERFVVDEELKRDYQHVVTPELAKVKLYEASGHYPYYKDTMYPVMKVDEDELILRPMTCPHHFMIYKSEPRSYRELPMKIAELANLYRYEKSGELTGLIRARKFCLADAHIFSTEEQAAQVIKDVLDLINYANGIFGLVQGQEYTYRLSLGDRNNTKKYFKDDDAWDKAEEVLRQVLIDIKAPYYEAADEAAFYGPKIDIQMKKAGGKEETAFTVQYDFVMPKRFDLRYTDSNGGEKQPVVIHRSSIGAFERIMAFLIEKFKGAFPVWLSPIQARIIPITDKQLEYAQKIASILKDSNIRVEIDDKAETMQNKIRTATAEKIPYLLIVGGREALSEDNQVSVRQRNGEDLGVMSLAVFLTEIKNQVSTKSLNLIK